MGQAKNTIDVDEIMNTRKILLVNVSKGRIGEDNSAILGAMIITKIQLAAMERVRIPEDERRDFYLYVDEFQNFATDSFVNILSEARKYRLNLIIAHQYVGQLVTDTTTAVRDAVFGNVGTLVCFRVGAVDAEFLEQEFTPEFEQEDLIHLPNYNVYIKLLIDGVTSRPFSAKTIAPPATEKDKQRREQIIRSSRENYSHKRTDVEAEITRWAGSLEVPSSIETPISISQSKPRPQSQGGQTTLYDAKCSNCGKWTKVIFPPSANKPVYCKSCLKKMKKGKTPATVNISVKGSEPEEKFEGGMDLAGLGIEFGPARNAGGPSKSSNKKNPQKKEQFPQQEKSKPAHLDDLIRKSEPVFFNPKKKKEVNLDELKKTLTDTLQKAKEEPQQKPPTQTPGGQKGPAKEEIKSEESRYDH